MLLTYVICALGLVLTPLLSELRAQEARVYSKRLREVRMTWLQKYYPELRNLSWEEIERNYPVSSMFDQIK